MKKYIKFAEEIEHGEDLNNITSIMKNAGATILQEYANFEEESATIHYSIEIPQEEFNKKYLELYNQFFGID